MESLRGRQAKGYEPAAQLFQGIRPVMFQDVISGSPIPFQPKCIPFLVAPHPTTPNLTHDVKRGAILLVNFSDPIQAVTMKNLRENHPVDSLRKLAAFLQRIPV